MKIKNCRNCKNTELFDLLLMVEIIYDNYTFLVNADLNQDGTIDEIDINLLINQILQL